MKTMRRSAKPVSVCLTMFMLLLSAPYQSALAVMVGTETVLDVARSQEARDYLSGVLAREDVHNALVAQGIDPAEAQVRVDSLSDAEVLHLARQIERLPSGSGTVEAVVGAVVIVFVILLITDLLGYTDVFRFVR